MSRFKWSNLQKTLEDCSALHPSLNSNKVINCASSNLGRILLHKSGMLTELVKLNRVPWITVNDEHSADIQAGTEYRLVRFLCRKFQFENPECMGA